MMTMTNLLVTLLCFIPSCSAVRQIATSNSKIQEMATSSKTGFEVIYKETQFETPDIVIISAVAKQGIIQQTSIIKETQDIVVATTAVKDIVPWWADMINYVMITLAILGVVFGLWYLGVGHLTKGLFIRFGWVSKAKQEEADLFREALDTKNSMTIKEAIAIMRAKDPELNQAFKKGKAKDARLSHK